MDILEVPEGLILRPDEARALSDINAALMEMNPSVCRDIFKQAVERMVAARLDIIVDRNAVIKDYPQRLNDAEARISDLESVVELRDNQIAELLATVAELSPVKDDVDDGLRRPWHNDDEGDLNLPEPWEIS